MDSVQVIKVADVKNYIKWNYLVDYDLPDLIIHHVHPSWRPSPDTRRLSDLSESECEMIDRPRLPSIYSPDWKTKKTPAVYFEVQINPQNSTEEPFEHLNFNEEPDNNLTIASLQPPEYHSDTTKSTDSSKSSFHSISEKADTIIKDKKKFTGQPKHFSFENEKTYCSGDQYPNGNELIILHKTSNYEDETKIIITSQNNQDQNMILQDEISSDDFESKQESSTKSKSARFVVQDSNSTASVVCSSDYEEESLQERSPKRSRSHRPSEDLAAQDEFLVLVPRLASDRGEGSSGCSEDGSLPREFISDSGHSADISSTSDESQSTVGASRDRAKKKLTRNLRKIASMRAHRRAHTNLCSITHMPSARARARSPADQLVPMTRDETHRGRRVAREREASTEARQPPVPLRVPDGREKKPRSDEAPTEERGPMRVAESSAVTNAAVSLLLDAWLDDPW